MDKWSRWLGVCRLEMMERVLNTNAQYWRVSDIFGSSLPSAFCLRLATLPSTALDASPWVPLMQWLLALLWISGFSQRMVPSTMQILPDPTGSMKLVSLINDITISSDPTSCPCWYHAGDKLMHPGVMPTCSELCLNHSWLVRQLLSTFTLFSRLGERKSEAAHISFCRYHLIFNIHQVKI